MHATFEANPFQHAGFWFWKDENNKPHGPYATQVAALWALMHHIDPPWYGRAWADIKRFFHDTRG